jgi:hypothetical protein
VPQRRASVISGGLTLEAQARIAKNRATALETQARIARNRAAALQRRVASQRQWPDPAAHGTTVRRKRRTTPDHTPADRELAEAAALAEEEEAMAAAAVAASQARMEAALVEEEEAMAAAAAAASQVHAKAIRAKEEEEAMAAAAAAASQAHAESARAKEEEAMAAAAAAAPQAHVEGALAKEKEAAVAAVEPTTAGGLCTTILRKLMAKADATSGEERKKLVKEASSYWQKLRHYDPVTARSIAAAARTTGRHGQEDGAFG